MKPTWPPILVNPFMDPGAVRLVPHDLLKKCFEEPLRALVAAEAATGIVHEIEPIGEPTLEGDSYVTRYVIRPKIGTANVAD